MKTLAVLFLVVPVAFANVITNPAPVVSTACTVGGSLVTCGTAGNPTVYGSEIVGADAPFSMAGLGTDSGLTIIAYAETAQGTTGPGRGDSTALATLSLDFLASTNGPQRPGLATFIAITDKEQGGGSGASAFDSIAGLGSCQFAICSSFGTLVPFELGVPFEITISLHSEAGFYLPGGFTGSGSFAEIQLQLFEVDGSPVTIFDPPATSIVPEPGSWILTVLGFVTLLTFRAKAIPASSRHS